MSPKEAGKEADTLKKMDKVKAAFLNITNVQSWDEATKKYPKHTDEEQLRVFAPKFTRSCEFYSFIQISYCKDCPSKTSCIIVYNTSKI